MIPVISIVARSGTGKTTFIEKLIPKLKAGGLRIAVVKHINDQFEIDQKGKDSDRITKAGADVTGMLSDSRAALIENRPIAITDFFEKITNVDLILTEGLKTENWPKILLYREAVKKTMPIDPAKAIAVVSDVPVEGAKKQFDLNDVSGVAEFILQYISE